MKHYRAFVWKQTLAYLSSAISSSLVSQYMTLAPQLQPKNLAAVYRRFLESLSNRQGMPNSIGDITRLSGIFHNFDYQQTLRNYPL